MRGRSHAVLVAAAIVLAACSPSEESEAPPSTTTTVDRPVITAGPVQEYLLTFDNERLGGVGLPASVETDRLRAPESIEAEFVIEVRKDPTNEDDEEVGTTLSDLDDESLVYLAYLYCAAHDQSDDIGASIAAVVDVVARANGRPSTAPAQSDLVASVVIVNLGSGSICPDLYLDTDAFLQELLGTA